MPDYQGLLDEASRHSSRIMQKARESRSILIVTHLDADGQASASLMAKALKRKKASFQARVVSDLTPKTVTSIREEGHDFTIFTDLGSGFAAMLKDLFGDDWIVIDHHETNPSEIASANVFNAWKFGYDGGTEICSTGMAYLIARHIDISNIDLSWLPVMAALADRQDAGEERSLIALNKIISEDAMKTDALAIKKDLALYGRETRPIHEALAATTSPFLPNLTGNPDTCLAILSDAGIKLKENDRWRTISELGEEEKAKTLETIITHLAPGNDVDSTVQELLAKVYTLVQEDEFSPLRDAREFGTLLNACGRLGRAGVGIAVCLGDRDRNLREAENSLLEYRQTLSRYIKAILTDENRIVEKPHYVLIVADGLVEENLVGAVCSILAGLPRFVRKPVLVRTSTGEEMKVSARLNQVFLLGIDLGRSFALAAGLCQGVGGGHAAAAGARIPALHSEDFLRIVLDQLQKRDTS